MLTRIDSIMAIMLGRLRMSLQNCLITYKKLARGVFDVPLQPLFTSHFHTKRRVSMLESELKQMVAQTIGNQNASFAGPDTRCKT